MTKRQKAGQQNDGTTRSPEMENASAVSTWTPEEMANARPMPLPTVSGAELEAPAPVNAEPRSSPAAGDGNTSPGGGPE